MRKVRAALGPVFMVAIAVGSVTAGMVACGGDDKGLADPSSMSCGPGTVAEGNQCVAVDAGVGGSGGEGGGDSGQGGTAGESAGGAAGADAETPEAASDVVEEGAPGPGDDPCPDEPLFLNCSDSCGPKSPECEAVTCFFPYPSPITLTDDSVSRIVIRTPSLKGADPKCAEHCAKYGEQPFASTLMIMVDQKPVFDAGGCMKGYRITAPAPWLADDSILDETELCKVSVDKFAHCRVLACDIERVLRFVTDDPTAGARNIVIERVSNPVKCP